MLALLTGVGWACFSPSETQTPSTDKPTITLHVPRAPFNQDGHLLFALDTLSWAKLSNQAGVSCGPGGVCLPCTQGRQAACFLESVWTTCLSLDHLALFLMFKAWSLGVRRKIDSAETLLMPPLLSPLPVLTHPSRFSSLFCCSFSLVL